MRRSPKFAAAAILLTLVWSAEAWGHSRRRLEPSRPALVQPAAADAAKGQPAVAPSPFTRKGKAGERDRAGCLADLLRQFNAHPGHPDRPQALLRLAREAREDGQVAKALQAYGLASVLFPGTSEAATARQERLILEFYQELGILPPLVAGRRFLEQAAQLPASPAGPALREAFREVWLAAARQVNGESPTPPALAEEVLTLFELHPPGSRPPEAALLVARLLQERGLAGEARQLLQEVLNRTTGHLKSRAIVELLELAWVTHGLPEFLATLARCHEEKQPVAAALGTWLLQLGGPGPVKTARFSAKEAGAPLGLAGPERLKLWEELSEQPLPPSLAAHILDDLANHYPASEETPRVARLYQAILEGAKEELGPGYYQDRAGLSHLKLRQFQAAAEAFQALAQDEDPFWQQVGRARLLDLELARLEAKATP